MAETVYEFNTPAGKTIARELLIAYLNVSDASTPSWQPIGKRVESSDTGYDWSEETKRDILGDVYTQLRKPVITQSFEPYELDKGDLAHKKIWDLAVVRQNAQELAAQDILIAHLYAGFGERYTACAVKPNSVGGQGGGDVAMPLDIVYGGVRTVGSCSLSGGSVVFTPEA